MAQKTCSAFACEEVCCLSTEQRERVRFETMDMCSECPPEHQGRNACQNNVLRASHEEETRHTLLRYVGRVFNTAVKVLCDCGASDNFMDMNVAKAANLKLVELKNATSAKLANGSRINIKHMVKDVVLEIGCYTVVVDFKVMPMNGLGVVLGKPWFNDADPMISWKTNIMNVRTPQGDFTISPNGTTSSIDFEQHNLVDINTIRGLSAHTNRLMCLSIHPTAYERERPDGTQGEIVCHQGKMYNLWVHDVLYTVDGGGKKATETVIADARRKALEAWDNHHKPKENDEQSFSEDMHRAVREIVEENIDIHIPHEYTPPGQTVTIGDKTTLYEHIIETTPDAKPPSQQPYRLSPTEMTALRDWIDNMLKRGFLRPSSSPYGAPILFVPKPDGSLRLCCDFRRLNAQTVKDAYPLPRCRDLFDQLKGAVYYTSFDMLDGYYNVRMAPSSVPKTAIRTPLGSFEFLVLPMGLTNAPSSFARLMEIAFRELDHRGVLVYLDDVLVYSNTREEHLQLIKKCFAIFKKYNFRLKPSKCHYFMTHVTFLGHIISKEGIATDPRKIDAIKNWPELKSVQQVQQFMGLVNYYRDHIKGMATISKPLTDIQANHLKDVDFSTLWKDKQRQAFTALKEALTSTPVLAIPDMNQPFFVTTDASGFAMGGALEQLQNGKRRVIAYMSKKFTAVETRWSPYERELFAIFSACKAWRHYIAGARVVIESDHKPLIWLRSQKTLSRKQANWMTFLEEFSFVINYVPGKDMAVADPLSRRPDHEVINYHAIDEQRCRWVLHPDLFQQMNAEYGPFHVEGFKDEHTTLTHGDDVADFYETTLAGKHSYINGPYDSKSMSRMMAYYEAQKELDPYNTSAIILAPLWTQKRWYQQYFSNMQLVQVLRAGQHAFLIPSDRLGRAPGKLVDVGPLQWDVGIFYDTRRFQDSPHRSVETGQGMSAYILEYMHYHPDETLMATSPMNPSAEPPEQPVDVTVDSHPLYDSDDDDTESDAGDEVDGIDKLIQNNQSTAAGDLQMFADWIHELKAAYMTDPFVQRLRSGERIPNFRVASGVVYHQKPDQGVAVMYVPPEALQLQHKIIAEFHDTLISGHLSAAKTLERLKRFFYWPRMDRDVDMYIKSCHECKRHKRRTVARPANSTPFPISDYPWQIMAMDMKSGLPTTSRGVNAFWVFVDKLTRRGHVVPCSTTITAPELARLFFDHVFKHHGIPEVIISDRDSRFGLSKESFWRELWKLVGTRLNMSTANRPQTDGLAERYIGTISSMARTFANQNPHNWDLYMSALEFAYNDSVHPATGYTPFQLDMGRDPNTPIQFLLKGVVDRPALYHQRHEMIDPTVYLQKYTAQLSKVKAQLADKQREQHQRLMHKGTIPIVYEPEDGVYVENPLTTHRPGMSTLDRRYDGPYRIIRRETINSYRVDFAGDFPGRYNVINVEKLIPYVNRLTGEATLPRDKPEGGGNARTSNNHVNEAQPDAGDGDANHANREADREVTPPPHDWGSDPMPTPEESVGTAKELPYQKTLQVGSQMTRILEHREREVFEDIRNADGVRTHRVRQAEMLVVFKRRNSNTMRRAWIPLKQLLLLKNYDMVHAYLQQHPELQHADRSRLFKHGTAVFNGTPYGAYVVSQDMDDEQQPFGVVYEDGDNGDYSARVVTRLLEQPQVDMADPEIAAEMHMLSLGRQRIKTVRRILVLCSGTNHDAIGLKRIYPSAKIHTLDLDGTHKPTIQQDILTWQYTQYPRGYFDIIYASPQCTAFSRANPYPDAGAVDNAVRMVSRTLEIIKYFNPCVWILENPVNRLQEMDIMQPYSKYLQTVSYCLFGTPFRKDTSIWSNVDVVLPRCTANSPCPFKGTWGFHRHSAQSGPARLRNGTVVPGTPAWKAQQMPFQLLEFITRHITALR